MSSSVRVKSRISSNVQRTLDHMSKLKGRAGVKVGLPKGSNRYPKSGESVINVGFWLEFGTKRMAPHSWMRPTMRENAGKYARMMKQGAKALQQKRVNLHTILSRLGSTAVNDLVAKINQIPIVDTGHLKQSQSWQILIGDTKDREAAS